MVFRSGKIVRRVAESELWTPLSKKPNFIWKNGTMEAEIDVDVTVIRTHA